MFKSLISLFVLNNAVCDQSFLAVVSQTSLKDTASMWIFGRPSAVICLIMVWAVALKGYRYFTHPPLSHGCQGYGQKRQYRNDRNLQIIQAPSVLAISSRVFTMKKLLSVLAKSVADSLEADVLSIKWRLDSCKRIFGKSSNNPSLPRISQS